MKYRELFKIVEKEGWYLVKQEGNAKHFKHSNRMGKLIISGKPNDDVYKITLANVLKQSRLKELFNPNQLLEGKKVNSK